MSPLGQIAIFLSLLLLQVQVNAFTVSQQPVSLSKSALVSAKKFRVVTQMSDDAAAEAEKLRAKARELKEEVASLSGTTVEEMEKKEAAAETVVEKKSGDLYDDEVAAYKDPLSDNMRARLMAEASTGLDSDKKQTNVILYISIAVAILVLLGGEGILY